MPIDDERERMQIAQRIVDYLFVNGGGGQAERLVMISCTNKNLGGWSKKAVMGLIVRELAEEMA
jgi:hypothetical protein